VLGFNSSSTLEVLDQCLRVNGVNLVEDARVEGGRLRTRGKSSEVLLWQGLRIKSLGERGSLWCC
jgi:hypothetical protein